MTLLLAHTPAHGDLVAGAAELVQGLSGHHPGPSVWVPSPSLHLLGVLAVAASSVCCALVICVLVLLPSRRRQAVALVVVHVPVPSPPTACWQS